jgi:hypothetical protein
MLCLAGRLSVEDEWSKTARDRSLSSDGGHMWFMSFSFGMWHNMRPDGATREKWRIPDVNVRERSIFMFRAPKVVAPHLCQSRTTSSIDYVLSHMGFMGSHKLISINGR